MLLITEKQGNYFFPEHKPDDVLFKQGNKAIILRKTQNANIGKLRVGYICISKRAVPLELQRDSSKDFMSFKEIFFIESNVSKKSGVKIDFRLHSMTTKRRLDFDFFCFGFIYDLDKEYLIQDELSPKIEIEKFWPLLKQMENKIIKYEG